MSNKFILGIHIGQVCGCALYKDGEILYALSEERLSRIKNDTSFPEKSLKKICNLYKLNNNNIEKITIDTQNQSPTFFLIQRDSKFKVEDFIDEQYKYWKPVLLEGKILNYLDVFHEKLDKRYDDLNKKILECKEKGLFTKEVSKIFINWIMEKIFNITGLSKDKIIFINHEFCHACYSYYGSPFRGEDVLILTIDAFGDLANCGVFEFDGKKIINIKRYTNFNIGRIWKYITLLLGMRPQEHEFKVMGLAPYATQYNYKKPLEVFNKSYQFNSKTGEIESDPQIKDHYFYFLERLKACRFDGIAGALQIFTENIIKDLVNFWITKTNKKRVVISGGVSLNIKANMEVGKLDAIEDLFVTGSGGDESLCIGSIFAYLDLKNRSTEIKTLKSLYLGSEVVDNSKDSIIRELGAHKDQFIIKPYRASEVAEYLVNGQIIGRISGKAEFGARALGNRSIIADPRYLNTIKKINKKIKNRDFWMPFTPSILDISANDYLLNNKNFQFPYMSVACETTLKAENDLPAALHPSDLTARPQIVTKSSNHSYYELINEFKKITGVGALLNTSLNLHGLPIVDDLKDAIHVLLNSELDGLITDKYIISRK